MIEKTSRRKTVAIGVCAILLALPVGLIGWEGTVGLAQAVQAKTSVVTLSAAAAGALPAAVLLCAAAAMLLSQSGSEIKRERRNVTLFSVMLVCFPLMLLTPLAFNLAASAALKARGYERCKLAGRGGRYSSTVWRNAKSSCPRN